ncbi:MAG: hypothetical protein AAGG07_14350 [Planctomycetota bacterium]
MTSVCATVLAASTLGIAAPNAGEAATEASLHEVPPQVEVVSAEFSVLEDIIDLIEEILGEEENEDPNPDGWVAL